MRSLEEDFERLSRDANQLRALRHEGNVAVFAGPGSGKTATMVVKAAYLLKEVVPPPRGVACITYNQDTVREFSLRLRRYGIRPSSRLFLGTVHSFCLNRILRPFATLVGRPDLSHPRVIGRKELAELVSWCVAEQHLPSPIQGFEHQLATIRKAKCAGFDLREFSTSSLEIVERFEQELASRGAIDFDGMVTEAVQLVRTEPFVCRALESRYPWLLIDEYQDLGGPLHRLVTTLLDAGGPRVFAVGDPDQSVYAFAGARPNLFESLVADYGFERLILPLNYRSGRNIIAASEGALAEPRPYRAADTVTEPGEIVIERVHGDFEDQARYVVDVILPEVLRHTEPHEVALLYPAKGVLLDAITGAFATSEVPHLFERDERFPSTPTIRWLQRAAAWGMDPDGEDVDGLADFVTFYEDLASVAQRAIPDRLELLVWLQSAFEHAQHDERLSTWLQQVEDRLRLTEMLQAGGCYPDDLEDLGEVTRRAARNHGAPLAVLDFAAGARVHGKVAITTYHGSKGRQFDVVILAGLQQTIMPRTRWDPARRQNVVQDPGEERRLFYVGITRARKRVYLISSENARNRYGYRLGESPLVAEVEERLGRV